MLVLEPEVYGQELETACDGLRLFIEHVQSLCRSQILIRLSLPPASDWK